MQSGLAGALQQGSVSAAAMDTPATHHIDDLVLLEGPHSRRRELWLVLRAVRDFIAGFRALHFMGLPSLCSAPHGFRPVSPPISAPAKWAAQSRGSGSP